MDKMREEFEAWVVSESERTGYEYMDKVLSKFGESYTTTWVDSSWQGWKSSRASLCVELPSFENGSLRGYSGDCDEARMVVDSVAESLDMAGVSYK